MVNKKNHVWMILAIIFIVLTLIFFIAWIGSSVREEQYKESYNYYREVFNKLNYCFENDLDECSFDNINNQYGYSVSN